MGVRLFQLRVLSRRAGSVLFPAAPVQSAAAAASRAGGCRQPGREWTLGGACGFRSAASAMAPIKVTAGRDRPELPSSQSSQCPPSCLSGENHPPSCPSGPLFTLPGTLPAVVPHAPGSPRTPVAAPSPVFANLRDSYFISRTAPKALSSLHPLYCRYA